MHSHEHWIDRALEEARQSGEDIPVGAVVVKDNKLLAAASNRRERDDAPFSHAEILVMDQAASVLGTRRLKGCTLYVTLEPCPMCAGAIIMAEIDRVVFGAFDKAYGCCGSVYALPMDSRFFHQAEVIGGVLEKESRELLEAFFASRRPGKAGN